MSNGCLSFFSEFSSHILGTMFFGVGLFPICLFNIVSGLCSVSSNSPCLCNFHLLLVHRASYLIFLDGFYEIPYYYYFFFAWVFVVETYLTVVSRLASGSWPFFLSLLSAGVHVVQLLSFSVLFFLLLCFNMQALRDTICDESRRVGSSPSEVSRLLTVDKVIYSPLLRSSHVSPTHCIQSVSDATRRK